MSCDKGENGILDNTLIIKDAKNGSSKLYAKKLLE